MPSGINCESSSSVIARIELKIGYNTRQPDRGLINIVSLGSSRLRSYLYWTRAMSCWVVLCCCEPTDARQQFGISVYIIFWCEWIIKVYAERSVCRSPLKWMAVSCDRVCKSARVSFVFRWKSGSDDRYSVICSGQWVLVDLIRIILTTSVQWNRTSDYCQWIEITILPIVLFLVPRIIQIVQFFIWPCGLRFIALTLIT